MVEQALLNLFSPNVPPIDDFFRGVPRESASLRTSTSVTFAYCPATHPIDPHLLSEVERQEVAKEEAERQKVLMGRLEETTNAMKEQVHAHERYAKAPLAPGKGAGEIGRNAGFDPFAEPAGESDGDRSGNGTAGGDSSSAKTQADFDSTPLA